MKINTIILTTTLMTVLGTGLMTCSTFRQKHLREQMLAQNVLSSQLTYKDAGLNLTGQALVLYNVTHPEYPGIKIRRLKIINQPNFFSVDLQGINGSLIGLLQTKMPYAFKGRISDYSPVDDFLKAPLITLSVLGYDILNADISLSATLTAPNQISVDLTFKQNNQPQMHFISKFTPPQIGGSVFQNLTTKPFPLYLTMIQSELKQRLDDYSLSKNLPFLTEDHQLAFPFLQK